MKTSMTTNVDGRLVRVYSLPSGRVEVSLTVCDVTGRVACKESASTPEAILRAARSLIAWTVAS